MMFILITLLITITSIFIVYYNWFYLYWKIKKIPCLQADFSKSNEHLGVKFKHVYDSVKMNRSKHGGVFLQLSPIYVPCDLNYIKNIMTKDFKYFPHRGLYYNKESDPVSAHIFNLSGVKWKKLRTSLNTIFTSYKLRLMFPILQQCEKNLSKKMDAICEKKEPIAIKELCEWFISDVIESSIFGPDLKSFDVNMNAFVSKIFNRSRIRRLKGFVVENFPNLGKCLNISLISSEASEFFLNLIATIMTYRQQNRSIRQDFMQLLIELKNEDGSTFTFEEIAAQCFIFFIAGMSTSPTAMSFTMYELSKNQHIQDEVRKEINKILEKYEGTITFDAVHEMKYLDKVFNEALRKYPPAAYLNRKCEEDYRVPDSNVVIEKGTTVVIPVLGIHYDNEFYSDPENFNPERFNEEKKKLRHNYAFIPFGEGPRICIGMRFGLMQSKLGLISLLKHFKFTINSRTKEPLKMKPKPLVLTAEGGIWLDVRKIS